MGFLDTLESGVDNVEKWTSNIFDGAENTVKYGVNTGAGLVKNFESTFSGIFSIPLLVIAGGLFFFLRNSNAGQVAEVTRNVGPALM
jgi:hypothetical protein